MKDDVDTFSVEFIDPTLFIEKGEPVTKIPKHTILSRPIPSQFEVATKESLFLQQRILYGVTFAVSTVFLLTVTLLVVGTDYFWTFLHTLQLYTHLVVIDV